MRVFIAEKPTLAEAIFVGLGGNPATQKKQGYYQSGNDVVTWCFGHMLALFDPHDYNEEYKAWSMASLPMPTNYPPKFKPRKGAEKQLDVILNLIGKSESLVHAGDPDAEGNLLIDEIIEYANYKKPVSRLLVADLNEEPVKKALQNMRPNSEFKRLTLKALSRAIADQMFGYNLTRAYTMKAREKGFESVLNIGRVITALIGMVNIRTLANQNHVKAKYYELFGQFEIEGKQLKAKLVPDDNFILDDKGRISSSLEAAATKEADTGANATVNEVDSKEEKKHPPMPYNLSRLQIDAAKKWGYTPAETLKICQGLYEKHKLITYPRSDNQYLGDAHLEERTIIFEAISNTATQLKQGIKNADLSLVHKAFDASKIEAHHAIVPTKKDGSNISLTEKEKNLYGLISCRFIALFYPESIREKSSTEIECTGRKYRATQTTVLKQGWEFLYKTDIKSEANDNAFDITSLNIGDKGTCLDVDVIEKESKPPKYFDEASLLQAMTRAADFIQDAELKRTLKSKDKGKKDEHGSIGTEATRGGHIEKLGTLKELITLEKEPGYKNPVFKTTQAGQEFCAALPGEIIMPDISAIWEGSFVRIEKGDLEVTEFLNEVDSYISERIEYVRENGVAIQAKNLPKCPTCQIGSLVRRKRKEKGFFHACNRFPDCKTAFPDKNGEPVLKPVERPKPSSTELCTCGKGLVRRKSAKGKDSYWWGCSGFPGCTIRYFDKDGKPDREKGALE